MMMRPEALPMEIAETCRACVSSTEEIACMQVPHLVSLHLLHGSLLILEDSEHRLGSGQSIVACRRIALSLLEQVRSP